MAATGDQKDLNPAYVQAVARRVNDSPYFRLLSMEIKSVEWGQSHLEILVEQKHLQPYGTAHGGVYASLIDAAAFWAVHTQIMNETDDAPLVLIFTTLSRNIPHNSFYCISDSSGVQQE